MAGVEEEHGVDFSAGIPAAYGILAALLDGVVEGIAPDFALVKLEGDAVFAAAAAVGLDGQGDRVVEKLGAMYREFIVRRTAAIPAHDHVCIACPRVAHLDLKMVLHRGPAVRQSVGSGTELLGPSVNMAHRLLKNTIRERIGSRPYLFITDAAAGALGVPDSASSTARRTRTRDGSRVGSSSSAIRCRGTARRKRRASARRAAQRGRRSHCGCRGRTFEVAKMFGAWPRQDLLSRGVHAPRLVPQRGQGGMGMVRSSGRGRGRRFSVGLAIAGLATTLLAPGGAGAAEPTASAPDGPPVTAIITYTHQPGAAEKQAIKALGGSVRRGVGLINGLVVTLPSNILAKARLGKNVKTVERDATITAFEPIDSAASTGDFEYDNAWGVSHIGAKAVHDAGITGAGVKVAVIDTGIDYIHDVPDAQEPPVVDPEFLHNYKGGYDFVNHDADPMDDNGHGTHVAGILAAERNDYLVVGVAPGVDLYALKILDAQGQGQVSDLILALQWAVDNHMDVVNMSLGTHEVSPALETAVANASAAGLLMVAASGNAVTIQDIFNGCPVAYPGAYPQVLSTTYTNPSDAITSYSCTGPEVDLAAPGDSIISTVPVGSCEFCSPNGYAAESGTSMASPHLAGTVALMLSAGVTDTGAPGLFDDVRAKLCSSANVASGVQGIFGYTPIPPGDPRYASDFGCGVLDAAQAVLGYEPPPPPNDPPVAGDDTLATYQYTAADANVLANDTDPNGDTLTVSTVSTPLARHHQHQLEWHRPLRARLGVPRR